MLPFIVLLLIQWVIWKISLNKNNEKHKRELKIITGVGMSLFLCCAVQLGINEYNSKFHRDAWLEEESKRVYIVDDLLEKHKLVGKSKEEVLQLLGNPTETGRFKETNQIIYYLGDERGFIRIDSERLVLYFNDNDKVMKYKIQKD
ncbi:outer membrane protein assembly factor BamE domain-containing protein [Bacillus gaemokensis]|uniref:outer membrane protein assembly factor BamE domain-containing protein n=1 Tax=Bacillus gaemokensis TaxID=574375 RepID=UPI000AD45B6A|nr:outer membrane protein assembly factor BamE [Bacillus gaemokensis]